MSEEGPGRRGGQADAALRTWNLTATLIVKLTLCLSHIFLTQAKNNEGLVMSSCFFLTWWQNAKLTRHFLRIRIEAVAGSEQNVEKQEIIIDHINFQPRV